GLRPKVATVSCRWIWVGEIAVKTMKLYLITLAAMAAVSAQNLSAAELSGKVTLKGTPPPETKIATMDPTCGKLNNNQLPTTRHYVTSSDGGLANVWVFIKNPPAGKAPAAG